MPNWFLQLCGNKPHGSPPELTAIGNVALTDHPTQKGQWGWQAINVRPGPPQHRWSSIPERTGYWAAKPGPDRLIFGHDLWSDG